MNEKIGNADDAVFTADEARVIACLMEKQLTTPGNYPLSIYTLVLACNQKSNREPVMKLSEGDVGHIVNTLADRKFIRIEYGDRANRVFHLMRGQLDLDIKQQAVLAVLMLRKPLTANDIRARTARMTEFEDLANIHQVLDNLQQRERPLVVILPKGEGRREDRYTHTLCGEIDLEKLDLSVTSSSPAKSRDERYQELEERIQVLEAQMRQVLDKFDSN